MKGPGIRIDLDVRRTWRCSRCGRVTKFLGDVVALRCGCSSEPNWMQLEDLPRRARAVQQAVVHPATADEAADAFDERENLDARESSPAHEPSVPAAHAQASLSETSSIKKLPDESVEVRTRIEEITVIVTETTVPPPTVAPPAPLAETPPPEDDFGAGLLD